MGSSWAAADPAAVARWMGVGPWWTLPLGLVPRGCRSAPVTGLPGGSRHGCRESWQAPASSLRPGPGRQPGVAQGGRGQGGTETHRQQVQTAQLATGSSREGPPHLRASPPPSYTDVQGTGGHGTPHLVCKGATAFCFTARDHAGGSQCSRPDVNFKSHNRRPAC